MQGCSVNNLKNKPVFCGSNCSDNEIIYPSLSVIIPACNEEESITQTISHLLDQDYPNFEVIVVNDRSTDHTGIVLEELKIKYPQLKVVNITDLPPQWLGKNHAIYQGVKLPNISLYSKKSWQGEQGCLFGKLSLCKRY